MSFHAQYHGIMIWSRLLLLVFRCVPPRQKTLHRRRSLHPRRLRRPARMLMFVTATVMRDLTQAVTSCQQAACMAA